MAIPDVTPDAVLGTVVGGGFTLAVARHFLLKALSDLGRLVEQVNAIAVKLSAIEVQLGDVKKLTETSNTHDRQITEIQSRLKYERQGRDSGFDPSRKLTTSN